MSRTRGSRALAIALVGAVVLSAVPALAGPRIRKRAAHAAGFLARQQKQNGSFKDIINPGGTGQVVVAMVAAGRGRRDINQAMAYLARKARNDKLGESGELAGLAHVVLAVVATKRNPKNFGGRNLVHEIKRRIRSNGRIGRHTTVYGHALLMLALRAAHERVPFRVWEWLLEAQCSSGGWNGIEPSSPGDSTTCDEEVEGPDVETTSLAVQALKSAGARVPRSAFGFFQRSRDPGGGGWGYSPSFAGTDAFMTGRVIQAYIKTGRNVPDGAERALRGLQARLCGRNGGGFDYNDTDSNGDGDPVDKPQLYTTVGSIPGLVGKSFPVRPKEIRKNVPRSRPCRN